MVAGQRTLYEDEIEGLEEFEAEGEGEGEEFLGTIARGIGGLLGVGQGEEEFETEDEQELEFYNEGEDEGEDELFLGTVARGLGSPLGQGQGEYEEEYLLEGEAEEFLRRAIRGAGGWLRRAAPHLRRVVRVAAPLVGSVVGGPLGGALGRGVAQLVREAEDEFEYEYEDEYEAEWEYEDEQQPARLTPTQAHAEMMAAVAAGAATEAEAEAMIGAATLSALTPRERAQLERVLANLVRGSAVLVRLLWRQPLTRPAIRLVPSVIRSTARVLATQPLAGRPITPRQAARVMAGQTRRVLADPRAAQQALRTNVRGTVAAARRTRPVVQTPRAGRPRAGVPVRRAPLPAARRTVGRRTPQRRPRPGDRYY